MSADQTTPGRPAFETIALHGGQVADSDTKSRALSLESALSKA